MKAALALLSALCACSSAGRAPVSEVPRGEAFTVIPVGDAGTRYVIDPQSQSCFLILGRDYLGGEAPESPQPIDCAALAQNLPVAKETITWSSEPAAPSPAKAEAGPKQSEPLVIDEFITRIDDTHYVVAREFIDTITDQPERLLKGARIVPSVKNGSPNGFKLYAVRPSSIYAKLGFANGDTVQRFNDIELISPDKAIEALIQLSEAKVREPDVTITVLRRGTPITIHYRLR